MNSTIDTNVHEIAAEMAAIENLRYERLMSRDRAVKARLRTFAKGRICDTVEEAEAVAKANPNSVVVRLMGTAYVVEPNRAHMPGNGIGQTSEYSTVRYGTLDEGNMLPAELAIATYFRGGSAERGARVVQVIDRRVFADGYYRLSEMETAGSH